VVGYAGLLDWANVALLAGAYLRVARFAASGRGLSAIAAACFPQAAPAHLGHHPAAALVLVIFISGRAHTQTARRLPRHRDTGFGEIIRVFLNSLDRPIRPDQYLRHQPIDSIKPADLGKA
jgi:hypothetical protein